MRNVLKKAMSDRGLFRQLSETPCSGPFHPEEDRGIHVNIVDNRLKISMKTAKIRHNLSDQDLLTMQAVVWCHDLGCIHCTKYNESKKSYTAYGHEKISYEMMADLKDGIEEMGADYETARWLVLNHMKAHFLKKDIMKKPEKILALTSHPAYSMLMWMEQLDDMLLDFDGEIHC